MQTVANTARALVLSLLLDPRALTALAAVVALCAVLLLGAGDAAAGGRHRRQPRLLPLPLAAPFRDQRFIIARSHERMTSMRSLITLVPPALFDTRLVSLVVALVLVAAGLVLGVDTTEAR